jgi:hypothetical protein
MLFVVISIITAHELFVLYGSSMDRVPGPVPIVC